MLKSMLLAALALQITVHPEAGDMRIDVSGADHKPFQSIWFRDGKAIGLENRGPLPISPNSEVDIEVTSTPLPSYAEARAVASAILRTTLKLLLNDDKVKSVKLPDAAFSGTLQELQFRNMKAADEAPPAGSRFSFRVESRSGFKRLLYY